MVTLGGVTFEVHRAGRHAKILVHRHPLGVEAVLTVEELARLRDYLSRELAAWQQERSASVDHLS